MPQQTITTHEGLREVTRAFAAAKFDCLLNDPRLQGEARCSPREHGDAARRRRSPMGVRGDDPFAPFRVHAIWNLHSLRYCIFRHFPPLPS
jgi:hypothetical protein